MCGVDLSDGDEDTLSRKLMADPGYEDAADDVVPQSRSWLPPVLGGALDNAHEGGGESSGRYTAPAVRYDPPDVSRASAPGTDGPLATWREGAGDLRIMGSASSNPLDDLNALMAQVEELEAAGDLDAAARLLSGAVQRR